MLDISVNGNFLRLSWVCVFFWVWVGGRRASLSVVGPVMLVFMTFLVNEKMKEKA